jgi:hypothetical protein
MLRLLQLTAALEAITGLTLMVVPALVVRLLLGDELSGAGIALGRVAGFALVGLGLACWPASAASYDAGPALRGMLIYNLLIAGYLTGLGLTSPTAGVLLWPGVALHGILTVLFVRESLRRHSLLSRDTPDE